MDSQKIILVSLSKGKIDSSLFSVELDVEEIEMLVKAEYEQLFDEE